MKLSYKLAIILPFAAATAAGIINVIEHRRNYTENIHLEARVEELQEQAEHARDIGVHVYERAGERIDNGMFSMRYGNTSNKEDIAFALGAVTAVFGGLYFIGKFIKKN